MELLVTVAIVGIVATMAVPNLAGMLQRNQRTGALSTGFAMFSYARSEAVGRIASVSVCSSSDESSCNTDNWEEGWITFVDNGDGTGGTADDGARNGTEALLRVGQAASGNVTIRLVGADVGAVTFDSDGMVSAQSTLIICIDTTAAGGRAIVLNVSGQARLATDDNDTAPATAVNAHTGGKIGCPTI